MSISDEISRLEQLRSQGTLTDEEFVEAKQQVLDGVPGAVEIISDGRIFGIPENTWCLLMHLSQLTWFTTDLVHSCGAHSADRHVGPQQRRV